MTFPPGLTEQISDPERRNNVRGMTVCFSEAKSDSSQRFFEFRSREWEEWVATSLVTSRKTKYFRGGNNLFVLNRLFKARGFLSDKRPGPVFGIRRQHFISYSF